MNLKKLQEDKNSKVKEMNELLNSIKQEERAFTEEEAKLFEELRTQVENINKTISAFDEARKLEKDNEVTSEEDNKTPEEEARAVEERDIKDFAEFIRTNLLSNSAERATNFTQGNNGVIVPTTIANKIITTAYDMSPILDAATVYNINGKLEVPIYGAAENGTDITVGYGADFQELVAAAGKFSSVELNDYLIGALALIGNSLVNNTDVDLVDVVVNIIAEYIKYFLEGQALNGTDDKIQGCRDIPTSQTIVKETATITLDDLIRLKNKVKQAFRKGSFWVGNQNTQTALELLKDENGRPLFQPDPTGEFDGRVLGYPFYVSDNMPDIEVGKTPLYFGNWSGLALKTTKDVEIQVLKETYATQHATGVVAWLQADIRVEHRQKLAKLTIGTAE